MVFNCNPNRKHAKYGHCWHKHNAAKSDAKHVNTKWTQTTVKDHQIRCLSWSVKNLKWTADAGKRRSSFRAQVRTNARFAQWLFVRDIYSNISTSNSDERYGLPKSDEFLSLVKFECGFVPLSCTFQTQNHFIDKIIVVIMCVLPWCLIVQPAFLIFVYN